MLISTRDSSCEGKYKITEGGLFSTILTVEAFRPNGSFELQGCHKIKGEKWGETYKWFKDHAMLGRADGIGCKKGMFEAHGLTYKLSLKSIWGPEEVIVHSMAREEVGLIKRVDKSRGVASAVLTGLPSPVRIPLLVMFVLRWDKRK